MKKRTGTAVMIALMLILTGCVGDTGLTKTVEDVDKSTRITTYTQAREEGNFSVQELGYVKDGIVYKSWFSENLKQSLDWLKANSKPSDKVLTWWDNGHIIRGYARREPIVYAPVPEIKATLADQWEESTMGPMANKEDLTNVAYALLADSPVVTQSIMRRYGTRWVYVVRLDQKKIEGMTILLGEDMNNYVDDVGDVKEGAKTKVLFKMADGWPVKGFEKRYEDDYATIYELPG